MTDELNPITRLYTDIITILNSLTIKYISKADEYETIETKSRGDRYICALNGTDSYSMYDDYSVEEFKNAGITDENLIAEYQTDRFSVPIEYRDLLLVLRRKREIKEYEEPNNYYRRLNGIPDIGDTDFFYATEELNQEYGIPTDIPIHLLADLGESYYVSTLVTSGYIDQLIKENPDKEYLKHIGSSRVPISYARQAKNFSILYVNQADVMESTYREFVRSYEQARIYFISTCYVYELKDVIPYYDNFIALCIFIMAIQQVSVRCIENATEREFYDAYMVRLLYETYGLPYFERIDSETQKLLVQNMNILIQEKATDKVLIDVASLLGFNDISIFQYYLVKERNIKADGTPQVSKKKQINSSTGKEEEVYDYKAMYNVHFQKVNLGETNIKKSLLNSKNKVDFQNVVFYDPYWWDDDELYSEIYEREFNYLETKYLGASIPYRITETLFDAIIPLKIIAEHKDLYKGIQIVLPRITENTYTLPDTVYLFLALMAKKLSVSGQIISTPSKLIHVLETIGQDIDKENKHIEALSFNFEAFSPERIEETRKILEPYLRRKKNRIVNGHDVDLNADGTQNTWGPTKLVAYTDDTIDLDIFLDILSNLADGTYGPKSEKVEGINLLYKNSRALYEFLSYQMSLTTNPDEYYALKTFYDVVFYTDEINSRFKIQTEDGERTATTFDEYFMYTDSETYEFLQNVAQDDIYSYIDHIIYKMSDVCDSLSSLYLLNDGSSPLMDLLEAMLNFFKSYRMDFIELSSLMIVDWEMENTFRFFGDPHSIKKTNVLEEKIGTNFSDVIGKYIATYSIEDRINLSEYLNFLVTYYVDDQITLDDLYQYMHILKTNAIKDEFRANDYVSGLIGTIRVSDDLHLEDVCVKKQDEGGNDPYEQDQDF